MMIRKASKQSEQVFSFSEHILPLFTGLMGLGLMGIGLARPAWLPRGAAQAGIGSVGLTAALTLVRQAQQGSARRGLVEALTLVATAAAAALAGGWAGRAATAWAAGRGLAAGVATVGGLAVGFLAGLGAGGLAKRAIGARRAR